MIIAIRPIVVVVVARDRNPDVVANLAVYSSEMFATFALRIEPANFRFVAQHLNHCATAVPTLKCYVYNIKVSRSLSLFNLSIRVVTNADVLYRV